MNILEFTLLVALGSWIAGFLGALTGLGGGVVLVPLLTLFFKVDIRYAIGASLVSVIATSSGAAAAYVKEGFSNIRIGMFLEIATTLGALLGAFLATKVPAAAIAIIFGLVLVYSAYLSKRPRGKPLGEETPDPLATRLRLNGSFPTPEGIRNYCVRRVPAGFSLMFGAGALSGLLGIGYIDPGLAMPVMLGVLAGSVVGTRVLMKAETKVLRIVFSLVIVVLGLEMIYKGVTGRI
jgi:uncharacterized membrane protein YfcA